MSMGWIAAAIAITSTIVSIDQGKAQERAQKRALKEQKYQEGKASLRAQHGKHISDMEKKKASRKRSNAQRAMNKAAMASQQGPASTLMGGAGGGKSLLGGRGTT